MELGEFFRNLLGKGKQQEFQPSNPVLSEREKLIQLKLRYRKEQAAREALFKLYTARETALADIAADQGAYGKDVDSRRAAYDMGTHFTQATGDLKDAFETLILSEVEGVERRRELQVEALGSAKKYWEQALATPDTSSDVRMTGRRRMTQINARLEELNPSSSQQNQSK